MLNWGKIERTGNTKQIDFASYMSGPRVSVKDKPKSVQKSKIGRKIRKLEGSIR